ncbi:hypothetical protein T07_13281, partial [Trichinella nelsoni]
MVTLASFSFGVLMQVNNEPGTGTNQIKEWSNSRTNFHRIFLLVVVGGVITVYWNAGYM